jgi:hypothetical protein
VELAAAAQRRMPTFELEISETNARVSENRTVELPHSFVTRLQLHVLRTPQQINYGSIDVKINGESANIIMTSRSEPNGVLCDLDLTLRAGFRLQPGRNSVEASARDPYGRRAYAAFFIDIRSEGNSGTPLRTETAHPDPTAPVPQIKLISPAAALSRNEKRAVFEGVVVNKDADWTLSIAGHQISTANPTAPANAATRGIAVAAAPIGNTFSFRQEIQIPDGASEVRVEVETRTGNRSAMIVPIVADTQMLTGVVDKYAVVIGVSKYQHAKPGFNNLRYARADAESFRDFLLSPEGGQFRPSNMITLLDEDATIQNIRTALFTFLTRSKENDQVVIYFAGHGAADPNNPSDLYFLAHDTDSDNMAATALPMWQMRDLFSRTIKTKRVVTFADACHSAGIGEAFEDEKNLINQYVYKAASADGRAIITASDAGELSEESERLGSGHGVFTYFLLQALQGQADANHDGILTAEEVFDFVRDHVTKETSGRQNPVAIPGLIKNQPLFFKASN